MPPSSKHRERLRGSSPSLAYASPYILPGRIIERYWSAATRLIPSAEDNVASTNRPLVVAALRIASTMARSIPVASIRPPKDRAQRISPIVQYILSSPPPVRSSSSRASPVSGAWPLWRTDTTSPAGTFWIVRAKIMPARPPARIAPGAGTRKKRQTTTLSGASQSNGDSW